MSYFTETQRLIPKKHRSTVILIIVVISISLGVWTTVSGGNSFGSSTIISIVAGFFLLYIVYRMALLPEFTVEVTNEGVHAHLPFSDTYIPAEEITETYIYNRDPGRGYIGIRRLTDGTKQYRMYGEAVQINYTTGPGLLLTLQNPQDFIDAVHQLENSR